MGGGTWYDLDVIFDLGSARMFYVQYLTYFDYQDVWIAATDDYYWNFFPNSAIVIESYISIKKLYRY